MRPFLALLFITIIISAISCSKVSNPVTPISESKLKTPVETISSEDHSSKKVNNYVAFGAWEIHINKENLAAEVIPARNASAIGDFFDADLSQFLTVSPCADCLWIKSISFEGYDRILLDVQMKHPFDNIYQRPDLHGFDVRAIFIGHVAYPPADGIVIWKPDGSVEDAQFGNYHFINPDGFTSHFTDLINDDRYFVLHEPVEGNLFPYLRFYEDATMGDFDPDLPTGYNVMPVASAPSSRTAILDMEIFDDEDLVLYVIADVAFGQASTFQNRQDPQYYLPAFNRTEPWRIEYWYENNNLDSSDTNSTADLIVQVFDWQGDANVDPNYPDPENLSGVPESSKVFGIKVLFPDMMSDFIGALTPEAGNGKPNNPFRYRIPIQNELGTSGVTQGFISVYDELYGAESPSGRIPIPESPSGFPFSTQDIKDYAYHQVIYANIPMDSGVTADYNNEVSVSEKSRYSYSGNIKLNPVFFMDRSRQMFQYDWDYDYDGITFDVDQAGLLDAYFPAPHDGINNIGLRVTTNTVPPREYIYTIPVYVHGEHFHQNPFMGSRSYTTSPMRGHSTAVTSDKCYVAYLSKSSGRWNIILRIMESDGSYSNHDVTSATDANYWQPSLTVVEEGPDQGVYLIFSTFPDGGDIDVYSSYGNLDGSGFYQGNVKPVSTESPEVEFYPAIKYLDGILYGYFTETIPGGGYIYTIRSTDKALTWTDRNLIDGGSIAQSKSSVTITQGRVYCVWEDSRNFSSNGIDLYLSKSDLSNPLSFEPAVGISPTAGMIHDLSPQICSTDSELLIAYLQEDITGDRKVHVQMRNLNLDHVVDNKIYHYSMDIHTQPSIDVIEKNRFVISYGVYNDTTNQLTGVISELQYSIYSNDFSQQVISSRILGTIESQGAEIYPCVASIGRVDDYAIESFVTFRNFDNGDDKETSPILEYFGELDFYDVITGGKDDS